MTVGHLIIGSLIIYVIVLFLFGVLPYNLAMMRKRKQAGANYSITDDERFQWSLRYTLIFGSLTAFLGFVTHVACYFLDINIPISVDSIKYSLGLLIFFGIGLVCYVIILTRGFFFNFSGLAFTRPLVGKRALLAIVFFLIWPWSVLYYHAEGLVFSYGVVIFFGSVFVLYALILPRVFLFRYREFAFTRPLVDTRVETGEIAARTCGHFPPGKSPHFPPSLPHCAPLALGVY